MKWTEEDLQDAIKRGCRVVAETKGGSVGGPHRAADPAPKHEPRSKDVAIGRKPFTPVVARCVLVVHCYHACDSDKIDTDNFSAKGIIDGIVLSGILQSDSTAQVRAIITVPHKVSCRAYEKTVIEIIEALD